MKKSILLIYLGFCGFIFSQTNSEINFNNGVNSYNEGNYNEAINEFKTIIDNGEHSVAVYFNLGNTYYKLNDIANSIYYYEKALKLKQNDTDVLNNLAYSKNMLIDKVGVLPKNQVSEFFKSISNYLDTQQWFILGIIFEYLFLAAFLIYFFNSKSFLKKKYFTISVIFFSVAIVFIFIGINRFENEKNIISAIIFDNEINFRTEPNFRSEVLFNLHKGTKVVLKEELNEWGLVEINDGNKGWIELESIKKIN